jgi:hypothetical protein
MSRVSRLTVLMMIATAGWVSGDDVVREGPSRTLDEGMGVSVNAPGVQHTLDMEWRWALSSSRDPLRSDAHFSLGVSNAVTPSYSRIGGWLEISPLSILDLRVGVEPTAFFGTFGSLMSFGGYRENFDDSARDARKVEARSGTGSRVYFSPTLKMRLGPVVAVTSASLESWRSSASGPLYYEPSRDTLLKVGGDGLLTTSSMILMQRGSGDSGSISFGIGHRLSYVWDAPENRSEKLGFILARQFGQKRFGLNAPKVGAEVSYYLRDPSRRGQFAAAMGVSMRIGR